MKVKIKKLHPDAVIPKYAKADDAGLDLFAVRAWKDRYGNMCYGTGLVVELPKDHVMLLFPRSSISKINLRLSNSVGVVDPGYRGEIILKFDAKGEKIYKTGERIGQMLILPFPRIDFEEAEELSETVRGADGFGSTGV